MADLYFTSPGGDELRIVGFDTYHPRLQVEHGLLPEWRDANPKEHPLALFAALVALAAASNDWQDSDFAALERAGFRVEGGHHSGSTLTVTE